MSKQIRPGMVVRQIVKPIEGPVNDIRWDPKLQKFMVHVMYDDGDGEPSGRWFEETEVAEVPAEEPKTEGGEPSPADPASQA